MIDIDARQKVARLLEKILNGGISNYALEDKWPQLGSDPAIAAIKDRLWCFYNDFPEECLRQECFTQDQMEVIDRVILFLYTTCEYRWPEYSFSRSSEDLFAPLLHPNEKKVETQWSDFASFGDIDVWPFLKRSDYELARSKISRLNNS